MLAYGKLNRDMMSNGYVGCKLGFEFSGLLNGRRIMGVAKQAIATHVFARDYLVSHFTIICHALSLHIADSSPDVVPSCSQHFLL